MYEPRMNAYVNETAYTWRCEGGTDPNVLELHKQLPEPYCPTPLIQLSPGLASHCQVGTVLFKDESTRFDTPSFKPLGAAWACHQTICAGLGLPPTTTGDELTLQLALRPFRVTLHAATDGRWGQAVACMADWLGIKARIYTPRNTPIELKKDFTDCAELVLVHGDYNGACEAARNAVKNLNREAKKIGDADVLHLLEAMSWQYDESDHDADKVQDLPPILFPKMVKFCVPEKHDKDDNPRVVVTEVNATAVDDGNGVDKAKTAEENDTNVKCPAEKTERRIPIVKLPPWKPCTEEPVSNRQMTPPSESQRAHLLVHDSPFSGYEKFPSLVVEGYSTMMREIDEDVHTLFQKGPDMIIVPVGSGSLAQAVVWYYKCIRRKTCPVIVAVEPRSSACLQRSLRNGQRTKIIPGKSIMRGMTRGEVSSLAWPILRDGVDIAITVTDDEVEAAIDLLEQTSETEYILEDNGPCSASTVAALWKLRPAKHVYGIEGELQPSWITKPFELGSESVVVLIGTESMYLTFPSSDIDVETCVLRPASANQAQCGDEA